MQVDKCAARINRSVCTQLLTRLSDPGTARLASLSPLLDSRIPPKISRGLCTISFGQNCRRDDVDWMIAASIEVYAVDSVFERRRKYGPGNVRRKGTGLAVMFLHRIP